VIIRISKLQDTEAKLSIQKKAECESSESITVLGQPNALVRSQKIFENPIHIFKSLLEFIQHSPFYELDEIEFQRDQSLTREMQW
jgi:hypothetical protein